MALEDLTRYESAGVAAMNAEKEPGLSLIAMGDFYRSILQEEDPIINEALKRASTGVTKGTGISDEGVINAIGVYGGKYSDAFYSTNFNDLVKYLSDEYKIPETARKAFSAYAENTENTLKILAEKMKDEKISKEDKENLQKLIQSMELLKERRLRAATLGIVNRNTTKVLETLYPKEEKKE